MEVQAVDALGAKYQFRERQRKERAHFFARPVMADGAGTTTPLSCILCRPQVAEWVGCDHAAPFMAAFTLSGVNGTDRRRTPIASNTAFEIADGTTAAAGSPAPHGFSFGRSIRS